MFKLALYNLDFVFGFISSFLY